LEKDLNWIFGSCCDAASAYCGLNKLYSFFVPEVQEAETTKAADYRLTENERLLIYKSPNKKIIWRRKGNNKQQSEDGLEAIMRETTDVAYNDNYNYIIENF
jgi:hypothetical protein